MHLALEANLRDDMVSSRFEECGEHVTIKEVLKLPPTDSCRILVNLESLYGICSQFVVKA